MIKRQTVGSVVCPNCGRLVGVQDERCFQCGRWNPGLWGYAPLLSRLGRDFGFTQLVIGGCVLLYVATLLYDLEGVRTGGLFSFLSPGNEALFVFGMSGSVPVFGVGRWWTVLSAAWLHGGLLHIFFNMLWIRQLAPSVGELYGVGRLVIIYTASSIGGFLLTSIMGLMPLPSWLQGASLTIGASAPLFGLFGAMLYYGRRTGNRTVTQQISQFVLLWVVIGFVVGFIDNWAHLGGLAGGYLASRILDPLRQETPLHYVAALICLAVTALSILVSILHAQPLV